MIYSSVSISITQSIDRQINIGDGVTDSSMYSTVQSFHQQLK
jgi:hypothetical protein